MYREMEVCREVNIRKSLRVRERKTQEDNQAIMKRVQRRTSAESRTDQNGPSIPSTTSVVYADVNDSMAIGATRKKARAMVIPNPGVVASVVASSIRKKAQNNGMKSTSYPNLYLILATPIFSFPFLLIHCHLENSNSGRPVGTRRRRRFHVDRGNLPPSDFNSYVTSSSQKITNSAATPSSIDSSYLKRLSTLFSSDQSPKIRTGEIVKTSYIDPLMSFSSSIKTSSIDPFSPFSSSVDPSFSSADPSPKSISSYDTPQVNDQQSHEDSPEKDHLITHKKGGVKFG